MNAGKAVVLVDGALDSATTLAIAKHRGFDVYALSFRRPRPHRFGFEIAERMARALGVAGHLVADLESDGSAAAGRATQGWRGLQGLGRKAAGVSVRDAILISLALVWASLLADDVFVGVNPMDPEALACVPAEYREAYRCLLDQARAPGHWGSDPLRVHTPLEGLDEAQIIRLGQGLGVDFGLTLSCLDLSPVGEACGRCGACVRRKHGFQVVGIPDPGRDLARMREAV